MRSLIGHGPSACAAIALDKYVDAQRGLPTLRDIAAELEKPGRDPRASFEVISFDPNITAIEHLQPNMLLPGVVTNVTAFGAFVDIGVHQDGLVHVSELAHKFVKDPAEVVKAGDRLKVRVLEVDLPRKRIALSIKRATEAGAKRRAGPRTDAQPRRNAATARRPEAGAPPGASAARARPQRGPQPAAPRRSRSTTPSRSSAT